MNSGAYEVMKGKEWKAINFDWDFSVGDNRLRRGIAIIQQRQSFIKMLADLEFEIYPFDSQKNVKCTRNLSKTQFLEELKKFKGLCCNGSCGCILVTVSSHGVILPQNGQTGNVATYEDYVLTHPEKGKTEFSPNFEDERVSVRKIVEIFKDPELKGIPKIFFIQACRDDSKHISGDPGVDVGVQIIVVEDESLSGTSVEFLPTPLENQTKNPGSDEGVQLFVGQDGSVSESTVTDLNVCCEDIDRESEENDRTFEIPLLYREVQKYVFRIFCSLTDFFTLMFLVENKDTKDDLQKILSSMGYKFPEVSEEVNIGLGSKVSADPTTIRGEIEDAINSVKNTYNIKVIRAKAILTDEDLLQKKCKEMSSEYHRGNISAHLFEGNILLVGRSGEALNELGRRLKEQQYIGQEQIEDLTPTASNSSGISAKIPQIPPESQIVYSPPCIDDSVIVFSTPFGYAAGFNTVRGSHVWSDLTKKFNEFKKAQRPLNLLDLLRETNWQLSQTEKTINSNTKVVVYKPLLSICHTLTRHIVFDRKAD
ncbi:uncharacterized protein LOC134263932 [Saccostrea cucullata]|uniref:uncharacterized protein LOC134263932 n=1 Tax=Saccostrea cuccullata TaxID=36930 RepID=UPI002ED65846